VHQANDFDSQQEPQCVLKICGWSLSTQFGAHKTVKAGFWQRFEPFYRQNLQKFQVVPFSLGSEKFSSRKISMFSTFEDA
jgi:hypothetical protein